MNAHYMTLMPTLAPMAYVAFALEWISCLVCIVLAIRFYMQGRGNWWIIAAIAFAAPLLLDVFYTASLGLPPLPYGIAQTQRTQKGPVTVVQPQIRWDFIPPIMAVCLAVAAYENSLKRKTPTARIERIPEPSE